MSILQNFGLPAFQNDFPEDEAKHEEFVTLWTTNVKGWINQGIVGNPWNVTNASNQTYFYNPLYEDIPNSAVAIQVSWFAFPNRLAQYLKEGVVPSNPYGLSDEEILQLADTGYYQKPEKPANSFKEIPTKLCPQVDWQHSPRHMYGPYGPRGWQDEYCEWSVTRNDNEDITRIDFACENPEYWYTLWKVDSEKVRELYEETLNYNMPADQKISVTPEDLQLYDSKGNPVVDPETERPAYNPLNKWNCGPISVRTGSASQFAGGVMHLTSTPNTLQTELGLAGAATAQRKIGNNNPQQLICCSEYGQNYRNSDPTIGQLVNRTVGGQLTRHTSRACLANPMGLYIQMPDFTQYSLPDANLPEGASVTDCWHIVRGQKTLRDPVTTKLFPGEYRDENHPNGVGNFILHAVFQIPEEWQKMNDRKLTLADIKVGSDPIKWAGQVVRTFKIGLYARPLMPASKPPELDCVSELAVKSNQPLQLMHTHLWDAYYAMNEPNPAGQSMSLASNTTFVVSGVEAGQSDVAIALTYSPASSSPPAPTVEFSTVNDKDPIGNQTVDEHIAAKVIGEPTLITNYAVPGNSYPSAAYLLRLSVTIATKAEAGLRGVRITDAGKAPAQFAPALLNVVRVQENAELKGQEKEQQSFIETLKVFLSKFLKV